MITIRTGLPSDYMRMMKSSVPDQSNFKSIQALTQELNKMFPGCLVSASMDTKSGEIQLDCNGRKLKATWQPKKDWAQLKSNTNARDAIEDLEKQLGVLDQVYEKRLLQPLRLAN